MGTKTTSSCIISLVFTMIVFMMLHSSTCLALYEPEPLVHLPEETKLSDQNKNFDPQFFDGFFPFQPCLAAVSNKGGCVAEIYKFRTGQATKFRDVCCKAMLLINDKCWGNVLPYQPFFPSLMKSYCTTLVGGVVGGGPGGKVGGGVGGAIPAPPR